MVCYTIVNGVVVIHGIQYNTGAALLNTHGFLNTETGGGYGLTPQELQRLLGNGNPKHDGWKKLPSSQCGGLSEEKQKKVYEDYFNYRDNNGDMENKKKEYIESLKDYYESPSSSDPGKTNQELLNEKYGDRYGDLSDESVESLPPEVLMDLLDMYGRQ